MDSVTLLDLAIAVLVTFGAAVVHGSVGIGFNILAVPILALVNPTLAPVPQLVVSTPLAVAMVWRERGHVDVSGIGWILGGRVPGAVIGALLLTAASGAALDAMIAASVLAAVAIIGRGLHVPRNPATEFTAGVLSGITGLVAAIGGPPLALLYHDERGPVIRSTLAVVFGVGLVLSLVVRGISGHVTGTELLIGLILILPMAVGFGLSSRFLDLVEGRKLSAAILILAAIAAVGLLVRTVFGA